MLQDYSETYLICTCEHLPPFVLQSTTRATSRSQCLKSGMFCTVDIIMLFNWRVGNGTLLILPWKKTLLHLAKSCADPTVLGRVLFSLAAQPRSAAPRTDPQIQISLTFPSPVSNHRIMRTLTDLVSQRQRQSLGITRRRSSCCAACREAAGVSLFQCSARDEAGHSPCQTDPARCVLG